MSDTRAEASLPVHETNTRLRMNWEFNPASILAILSAAIVAAAFLFTMNAKNEGTALAVTRLEGRVETGFSAVNARFDTLTTAVSPIATLNLRVTEAERRLTEQDVRDNGQDQRIGLVSESIAAIRARLDIEARPGRRVTP